MSDSRTSGLPPAWNDAVKALAEKIAATAGPLRTVWLEVKNISSLNLAEANAIQQELQVELRRRHLNFASTAQSEMLVHVTLSEDVERYIWSAEVHKGDSNHTYLFGVPRQAPSADRRLNGSITLDAELIWRQPGKFVDFKLFVNPVGVFSTLVIVNPEELAFYRSMESNWQLWHTIPIAHTTLWPRDLHGGFNLEFDHVYLPGVQCAGDFEDAKVVCSPRKEPTGMLSVGPYLPGSEGTAIGLLWDRCGDNSIALVSGKGDWTQPDTLQGYLFRDYKADPVRSGSPTNFDGPIVEIRGEGRDSVARAVVHNLNTGNYEAYVVTATCSH